MPELPDIVVYIEALERRIPGRTLLRCRVTSPFVLRSAGVQPAELDGHAVVGLRRLGKRIVIVFEGELAAVIHLMIAGRLHWKPPGAQIPRRGGAPPPALPRAGPPLSPARPTQRGAASS